MIRNCELGLKEGPKGRGGGMKVADGTSQHATHIHIRSQRTMLIYLSASRHNLFLPRHAHVIART